MSIWRRVLERVRLRRLQRRLAGPRLLGAFAEVYPEAVFVEIGANDGEQHDHLRPLILGRAWRGVMVEPVPYVFERLRRNYGSIDRIALENAAIAEREGELPFYYLRPPADSERASLPSWYDGTGSLSRKTLLGHADKIPALEQRLIEARVPSLTLESLCRKHRIERLDLLAIDTEGYDARILDSIDLAARHPRMIVYEHFHLDPAERRRCRERIEGYGYEAIEEGFDTWCLDAVPEDALTALWRRVEPAVSGAYVEREPA